MCVGMCVRRAWFGGGVCGEWEDVGDVCGCGDRE